MRYEEVRIDLSPGEEGRVGARVRFEGQGLIEHEFMPPEGIAAEPLYQQWREARTKPRAGAVQRALSQQRAEMGWRLFEALFANAAGPLRERFIALDQRREDKDLCGLRVRLVFGDAVGEGELQAGTLLPVAGLPWELLHDRGRRRLLARDSRVSIVRTVGAADPPRSSRLRENQLRVLVVASLPEGSKNLDWPAEKARIEEVFAKWKYAQLEFLDHASFQATCRRLGEGSFHILHFIGHGGFHAESGRGFLLFEDHRKKDWVFAEDIADGLGDCPTLRVAVLNACRTGQLPAEAGGDPLGGVATALSVRIPVVVAMQIPVTDAAAIEFSKAFYGTLRSGLPVEASVAHGRMAVRESSPEWSTPVVYMRGASSELFEMQPTPEKAGDTPIEPPGEPVGSEALKLGIRTFVHSTYNPLKQWAAELSDKTERFLPLEELFVGRFIRDPEDWTLVRSRLDDFLRDAVAQHRPLVLFLAAHATVAFASGYYFGTKEDVPLSLIQIAGGTPFRWSALEGTVPQRPLWQTFEERPLATGGEDVAVAVEITQSTAIAVEKYFAASGTPVGRLVRASIAGEPGQARVESGAHAFELARSLHQWLKDHAGDSPQRRLHLFISAPNGFVFFFGQLASSLGRVQLYEYDFERTKHGTYEPSLALR